jgi:hypothetical protein
MAKFYTFYIDTPDEDGDVPLYTTATDALAAAEECDLSQFSLAEVIVTNVRMYRRELVEVPLPLNPTVGGLQFDANRAPWDLRDNTHDPMRDSKTV